MADLLGRYPYSFAAADDGQLYAANGIGSVWRWSGEEYDAGVPGVAAGVPVPSSAPSLSFSVNSGATQLVASGLTAPLDMIYDPVRDRLWVVDGATPFVKYIDLDDNSVNDSATLTSNARSLALDDGDANKMYVFTKGSASTEEIDYVTLSDDTETNIVGAGGVSSIAAHPNGAFSYNGFLFYLDDGGANLVRQLEGGGSEATASSSPTTARGLCFDPLNQRLYLGQGATQDIYYATVSSAGVVGTLTDTTVNANGDVSASIVDPQTGDLYWADDDGINFLPFGSTTKENIVSLTSKTVYGMAIGNNRIYWVNSTDATIDYVPLKRISGIYNAYVRFIDQNGVPGAVSLVSEDASADNSNLATYTNVPVTSDARVAKRQILRNTNGQGVTYYVDIETTDLSSTTLYSAKTDDQLQAGTSVPLFATDGTSNVSNFGPPPQDRPFLFPFRGRLFAFGERVHRRGSVVLTNGSTSVSGFETDFDASMVGQVFTVPGETESYEISAVTNETTLALTENFAGTTGIYEYRISLQPANRWTLYWSRPGQPQQWSPFDGIQVGTPGLAHTAMFEQDGVLHFCQSNSLHQLLYTESPAAGKRYKLADRGCVSQRCVAQLDGYTYLIDRAGPYVFDGDSALANVAEAVSSLFRTRDNGSRLGRVNWGAADSFHAVVDQQERIVRWFICTGTDYLPRDAICFAPDTQDWWTEKYPDYVGSSSDLPDAPTSPVLCISPFYVATLTARSVDFIDPNKGVLRRKVAKGTRLTVEVDPTAAALPEDVNGAPLTIIRGKGAGQQRLIVEHQASVFEVQHPFTIVPDETSVVQIGSIDWRWRSARFRWQENEAPDEQGVSVMYRPTSRPAGFEVRRLLDYDDEVSLRGGSPIGVYESAYQGSGRTRKILAAPRTGMARRPNTMQVELAGSSAGERVRINEVEVTGVLENQQN